VLCILGCPHKPSGFPLPQQACHTVHVCHRQVALAPPIAALLFSGIAGPAADALIDRGVDVERVRKISQCIAFLGPSALLTLASFTDSNWLAVGEDGARLRFSAPFALHILHAVTPFCCPCVLVRDCR
jgi:hypothetical protein